MQSHLTKGKSPTFGPVTARLVECGLAHLRYGQQGHIVEPLAFLSLMKWLQNQEDSDANLETNIRFPLAFQDSRVETYDSPELIVLYLLRMLRYPVPFSTIFNFHNTPVWVNDMVQVVGCLDEIGVVHYATDVDDVIRWIQTAATAPAVLVTTHLFGPDVMIRCSSPPLNSTGLSGNVLLIGQFKSLMKGNKESLDAGTISHALTSLHPDHWFEQAVSHLASLLSSPH